MCKDLDANLQGRHAVLERLWLWQTLVPGPQEDSDWLIPLSLVKATREEAPLSVSLPTL